MHKNGKWAKELLALQHEDGKWGWFHSLSRYSGAPVTTEQALRRLERLGYTIKDPCIQKAVGYMDDCLTGKRSIPDRREKLLDWDIFTALILSAWIRRFTADNANANKIAEKWAAILTRAFLNGSYDHDAYLSAYRTIWGKEAAGGRLTDFANFYTVSLLVGCLDEQTERAMIQYLLHKEDGIYYVYDQKLTTFPTRFASRETSRYLAAIELLAAYPTAIEQLQFVADWLYANQNQAGRWDMGSGSNDKVYFPLSDDWRKKGIREADCTKRVGALLKQISK